MIIELPQVGESVTEGTIVQWLKQVGDSVERYDPLVEVLTDKVSMEVPSPVAGVITELLAEEGETLPMGAPIASIQTEDAVEPAAPAEAPPSAGEQAQPVDRIGVLLKDVAPVGPTGSGNVVIPAAQGGAASTSPNGGRRRRRYSPAVQRLADEQGIDLEQVEGTGINGRVTRKDVLAYIETRGEAAPQAPSAEPQRVPTAPRSIGEDEERIPLSPLRRMIAANMKRSASEIPVAWTISEVDVSGLVRGGEMR